MAIGARQPSRKELRVARLLREPGGGVDEAAGQPVDALHRRFEVAQPRMAPARGERCDVTEQRVAIGRDERRRAGRRWRAHVGDEIADREIGFVADPRYDRQRRRRRPRCATTSSLNAHRSSIDPPPRRDDQHVDLRALVGDADRVRDRFRRAVALHGASDRGRSRAAGQRRAQRGEHVAQRRGLRRRHDADRARKGRQRPLALGSEPARRPRGAPSAARISRTARPVPRGAGCRR